MPTDRPDQEELLRSTAAEHLRMLVHQHELAAGIHRIFLTVPNHEMYHEVLRVVLEELDSSQGMFGYIDENGALVVPTMTTDAWDKCREAEKDVVFPREAWGKSSWSTAIRKKKSSYSNEASTLVPEGHIPIRRHMSAPIICKNEAIGLLMVANRDTDYTAEDVSRLDAIAGLLAPILHARLERDRAEEERKATENTLRESEERFRAIFDGASDGMFLLDLETRRFVLCNEACSRMLGFTREEFVRLDVSDIHPAEDLPFVFEQIGRFAEGKQGVRTDIRFRRRDGTAFFTDLSPALMTSAGRKFVLIVFKDITERKQAEYELRQRNEELSVLYAVSRDSALSLDLEQTLNSSLTATLNALGVEAGAIYLREPAGETLSLRVHQGLSDEFVRRVKDVKPREGISGQAIAQGEPVVLDVADYPSERLASFVVQEGIQTLASTPLVSAGQVVGAINLGTRRAHAFPPRKLELLASIGLLLGAAILNARLHTDLEEELAKQNEAELQYEAILATALDGFWIVDPEGRLLDVNDAYCDMIGYTREELLAMRIPDVEAAESPEETASHVELIMREGKDRFETRHQRKDGTVVDVEVSVQVAGIRGGVMPVFIRDITERKRADEELRKSEERFDLAVKGTSDGIWDWDIKTNTNYFSPRFLELLDYGPDELPHELASFESLLHPEDHDRVFDRVRQHLEEHVPYDVEYRLRAKGGEYRWFRARGQAMRDESGEPVRVAGSLTDITERKDAEDALRESESRFRMLFDQSTDGIFVLDMEGNFLDVNRTVCERLGYAKDEMLGKNVSEFVSPEFAVMVPDRNEKVRRKGHTIFESAHVRRDGTLMPVEVNARAIDYRGQQAIFSVIRDITERKKAEEELRQTRDHLQSLLDHANAPIITWNPSQEITGFNHAFEQMTGRAADEVIGEHLRILFPDDTRKESLAKIERTSGGEHWESVEIPILRADGQVRIALWNSGNILASDKATVMATIAQGQDITERKKAEETLRDSEERLSGFMSSATDAFTIWDSELNLVDLNQAALKYVPPGRRREDLIGRNMRVLEPGTEPSGMLDVFGEVLETGKPLSVDRLGLRLPFEGVAQERYLHVRVFKVGEGLGRMTTDITDRKRAEESVVQLNERLLRRTEQLETANTDLEAFSYSVSHDLRAPLGTIDGFAQALLKQQEPGLDEQGRHLIDRIRAVAGRMAQLIDDLLSLSRAAQTEMNVTRVDLSALASEIADNLTRSDPQRKVTFVVGSDIRAEGDQELTRLVLENLLGNAFKFTSKHKTARIEFGVTKQDGVPVYFVKDDGVGFDMAAVDKLFTPFERIHAKTEYPGTGVGLASVQRIVRRHGGRVWAKGEVDKGAIFYFTLEAPADRADQETPAGRDKGRGGTAA